MISLILALGTKFWGPVAKVFLPGLLLCAALAGIYLGIRHVGYTRCKAETVVKTITVYKEAHDAQQTAIANAPRSSSDVINRLRDGTF